MLLLDGEYGLAGILGFVQQDFVPFNDLHAIKRLDDEPNLLVLNSLGIFQMKHRFADETCVL